MSLPNYDKKILDVESVTSEQTSTEIELRSLHGVALQLVWSSTTAAASFEIEVSNNGTSWIAEGASQAIANDSGDVMIIIDDAYYKYIRVRLAYTSGTVDSAEVYAHAKGI